jgi:hypothetical protein
MDTDLAMDANLTASDKLVLQRLQEDARLAKISAGQISLQPTKSPHQDLSAHSNDVEIIDRSRLSTGKPDSRKGLFIKSIANILRGSPAK